MSNSEKVTGRAKKYVLDKIRNIGIIAHIDAGKTTTTEAILFLTGLTHKIGVVHEGDTTTDWMVQERERGVTIVSAAITTFWKENRINIIDTPGHVDFTAEVERSLRVLDGAVVVLDGKMGVEAQTENVWRQANKYNVPRILAANKINQVGGDFYKTLDSIKKRLSKNAYPIMLPIGFEKDIKGWVDLVEMKAYTYTDYTEVEKSVEEIPATMKEKCEKYRKELIEKVVENDDKLMEKYLSGQKITIEELKTAIRKATIDTNFDFFPMLGGDFRGIAVSVILDAVVDYLPSPTEVSPAEGEDPKTKEIKIAKPDEKEPFAALAFKVVTDPYVGRLVYFRVYSGTIESGSYVMNTTKRQRERMGRIVMMHADKREEIKVVKAGEIAAAVGLKDVTTGDTLCDTENSIILENIEFSEPVISMAIEPATKSDQEKMGLALKKLADEDPTFHVSVDQESGQTLIAGVGEFQLEIKHSLLKTDYGVDATVGAPRVAFRETIMKEVKSDYQHKKQSGGRGQFAQTTIIIRPLERGEGIVFKDEIRGGAIPKEYIPAVEKGVRAALNNGIKYGYPVVDIEARLVDGSFHEVDSSELAFHLCAVECIKKGANLAGVQLLEPIMKIEVNTPEEFTGDIIGDLSARRAMIEGTEIKGEVNTIHGLVPLSEMFGYSTVIRSKSTGRATFSMVPSHYDIVPEGVIDKLNI